MTRLSKLSIACPQCGSLDITYSCTPNCCFNHVCAACYTTFEPATELTGGAISGIAPPDPLPECTDPAAPCARCESVTVYMTPTGELAFTSCGAVLRLVLTEIAPG